MRFKLKIEEETDIGDIKKVKRFALFPIKTNGCIVWLEWYNAVYVFRRLRVYDFRNNVTYYHTKFAKQRNETIN